MKIYFNCVGCWSANKHEHDGRRDRDPRIENFSEAVRHIIEYPDHYVEAIIEEESEE